MTSTATSHAHKDPMSGPKPSSSNSNLASVSRAPEEIVIDNMNKKQYVKGKFLGKGGFAKCFEMVERDPVTDTRSKEVLAGKIVPKSLLVKDHQKAKMAMEIDIQRQMKHRHVVDFRGYFEDDTSVYILLELCRRRSLMELHKRRKDLTEPEVRYYMRQLLGAMVYLHSNKVIHRDLKLGNLFLNDSMELKIGDFGLATRVDFDGERKKTLCGTPNYIAPEVLGKKGHSYEVDMWSLGCILFTLLCGKPPFETSSLSETYKRIKRGEYYVPSHITKNAKILIDKLLVQDPNLRPSAQECLQDPFVTTGYCPARLPISCLTTAPYFKQERYSLMADAHTQDISPLQEAPLPPTRFVSTLLHIYITSYSTSKLVFRQMCQCHFLAQFKNIYT